MSVRSSSIGTASSGTAISVAAPAGTTVGDIVILVMNQNGTLTAADNNGSTPFTKDAGYFNFGGGGGGNIAVWSRRIQAGDPSTYNFTASGSDRWTIVAVCFQNPDPTTIYNVSPFANITDTGTAGGNTVPSVTTTVNNSIHCSVSGNDGASNAFTSTPSGYVAQQAGGTQGIAFCTKTIVSAGATGTTAFSFSISSPSAAISFAIQDGAAPANLFGRSSLDGLSIAGPKQFQRLQ